MTKHSPLKVAIFNSGQRQQDIAQRAGIDQARMSKIVNGFLKPTANQRKAIAKAMRSSEAALFPAVPTERSA